MRVGKLSSAQTVVLENLGVDVTADVLVPAGRGPGNYSYCEFCFHQRFRIAGDKAEKVCGNPVIWHGLMNCFYSKQEDVVEKPKTNEPQDIHSLDSDILCYSCLRSGLCGGIYGKKTCEDYDPLSTGD